MTCRAITTTQLARSFGVGQDEVDVWLEGGLPHVMLRGRILLYENEAVWWVRSRGYDPLAPHAHELDARIDAIVTTSDIDELAWDAAELRSRGAISRVRHREVLSLLSRIRLHVAREEWDDEQGRRSA